MKEIYEEEAIAHIERIKEMNWMDEEHEVRYNRILEYIDEVKPDKVLDVGCSFGMLLKKISDKGYNVIGIDISPTKIKYLKENGFNVFEMDVRDVKGDDFDLIIAGELLEHFDNPEEVLDVLKDKGKYFIFSTPYPTEINKIHRKNFTLEEHENLISKYFTNLKIEYLDNKWILSLWRNK